MRSRTGKDDMLKRERDRLTVKLTRFLTTLGAQTAETPDCSTGPQAMNIETLAGRLRITCYGDWLACRFDDVDRARALLPHGPGERLNSHSGKYNFHFGRITAEEALAAFRAELDPLLPVKRTDGATVQETPVCPAGNAMLTASIGNIRKLDDEETISGVLTILGVGHHIEFVRVHEVAGQQEPVDDPNDRYTDMQDAYTGFYQTVQVPGFEGEYVVSVLPYAR